MPQFYVIPYIEFHPSSLIFYQQHHDEFTFKDYYMQFYNLMYSKQVMTIFYQETKTSSQNASKK